MPEAALKANEMMSFLEKFSPVSTALIAIFGLAYIAYMIFYDWMCKREAAYKATIVDLQEQLAREKGQNETAFYKQCDMAYKMNDADSAHREQLEAANAKVNEANARADQNNKRADDMAKEAEKYRRQAKAVA